MSKPEYNSSPLCLCFSPLSLKTETESHLLLPFHSCRVGRGGERAPRHSPVCVRDMPQPSSVLFHAELLETRPAAYSHASVHLMHCLHQAQSSSCPQSHLSALSLCFSRDSHSCWRESLVHTQKLLSFSLPLTSPVAFM